MPIIVVPENDKGLKHECFSCFFNLIYGNFDLALKPVIKQEDTAIILYNLYSSGASKGIVLTRRNLIAVVELFMRFQASQYEYSSSKNVYLAVVPMFHIYGLSIFATGLFSVGSPSMFSALTAKAKGVKGSKLQSLV
jgi:4-coumarate--CoA ligase